jgi:hypothetical protein
MIKKILTKWTRAGDWMQVEDCFASKNALPPKNNGGWRKDYIGGFYGLAKQT